MPRLFCTLVMMATVLALCSTPQAKPLTFQGKTLSAVKRAASVPFSILVEEVLVAVGDSVDKDTPLLRYSLQPQEARQYQRMLADGNNELLDLHGQLTALAFDSKNASNAVKRDRELNRDGLVPRAEVQRSQSALDALRARQEAVHSRLKARERDYALLLQELNTYFGSSLGRGDFLPEQFFVTAPMAGIVIDMATALRPGMLIAPNAAVAMIAMLNPIQAEVHVHASEINRLHQDMQLEVEIPDLNNRKYPARVTSISWSSTDMRVGMPSFYVVQIDIDNRDLVIRPGYKVLLHFESD